MSLPYPSTIGYQWLSVLGGMWVMRVVAVNLVL